MRAGVPFRKRFRSGGLIPLALGVLLSCITGQEGRKTSSTSISTGNPVGLTFHFVKDSLPVRFSGNLEVYASAQIPAEGYRPDPLYRLRVDNVDSAQLDTSALADIPDTAWGTGSEGQDSLRRFNVVLSGESTGAILKGFAFDPATRGIVPPSGTVAERGGISLRAPLTKLADFSGRLPAVRLSPREYYWLFLYGTGFASRAYAEHEEDTLVYTLPKLPQGQHEAFLLVLPDKRYAPTSSSDTTVVFSLEAPLRGDSGSLQIDTIYSHVELPDSLKRP